MNLYPFDYFLSYFSLFKFMFFNNDFHFNIGHACLFLHEVGVGTLNRKPNRINRILCFSDLSFFVMFSYINKCSIVSSVPEAEKPISLKKPL